MAGLENTFQISLHDLLDVVPERYRPDDLSPGAAQAQIDVALDDLFEQLARGDVRIPLADLAAAIPPGMIDEAARTDHDTEIELPLKTVVQAIAPVLFAMRMAKKVADYAAVDMPDPFEDFDERTDIAFTPAATDGAAAAGTIGDEEPRELPLLGGVNLNTAAAQDLQTLPGVSRAMALAIVDFRVVHGPYRTVFDLCAIPRLGRKTFKHITGMPYNPNARNRRWRLAGLLQLTPADLVSLSTITEALTRRARLDGCMLADANGVVLAAHSADAMAPGLGPVLARAAHMVHEHLDAEPVPPVDALCMSMGGRMISVLGGRSVLLIALHTANRIYSGQARFLRRAATEIEWLLSPRGYAGRP